MKTTLQAVLFALLLTGILAAASYPSHSTTVFAMADSGAPAPALPTDDNATVPDVPSAPDAAPVGEGSGPMPTCSPWDSTCDPGPMFPKPKPTTPPKPTGEGSGPMPTCSPWDSTCDPGPMFPKPKPTAPPKPTREASGTTA